MTKTTALLACVALLGTAAALPAGCSSDDTSGGSSGTGTTSASSTTTSTSDATTTSSTSSGMGGGGVGGSGQGGSGHGGDGGLGQGGSPPELLNGCDPATAEDFSGVGVDIQFPVAGMKYAPACVRVKQGDKVSFTPASSSFAEHPLTGGTVTNGVGTVDPTSPIHSQSGDPFVIPYFADPGTYPYYCATHASSGMMGVVFVDP